MQLCGLSRLLLLRRAGCSGIGLFLCACLRLHNGHRVDRRLQDPDLLQPYQHLVFLPKTRVAVSKLVHNTRIQLHMRDGALGVVHVCVLGQLLNPHNLAVLRKVNKDGAVIGAFASGSVVAHDEVHWHLHARCAV